MSTVVSLIPKEKEDLCIREIIDFFQAERGEEIGMIAAQEMLDFFEDHIAPHVHNAAISQAKKLFTERSEDVALDFELLKREV